MPINEKLARADFVINNEGSLEETRVKVEALWQSLQELQAQRKPTK
jgi:dephospho-CoA kinase